MLQRLAMLVIAVIIALGSGACTRISPGYVGVKVNWSGSNQGVQDYAAVTGRVWYNPINEDVFEYPTFVQNVTWTQAAGENHINEEITFTNRDKFPIALDVNVSYQLDAAKVPAFYVKFRNDDITQFSHGYLRNLTRDTFVEVGGKYGIDDIMSSNATFLNEVRTTLQKHLSDIGVHLVQFGIVGAPRPPDVVRQAIAASAQATQTAIRIQNELAQTEAEAKKRVAEAQGEAAARIARADAEATANRRIAESISPTLVEYMKAQKWDGALPQVTGNVTPMMNIRQGNQ